MRFRDGISRDSEITLNILQLIDASLWGVLLFRIISAKLHDVDRQWRRDYHSTFTDHITGIIIKGINAV